MRGRSRGGGDPEAVFPALAGGAVDHPDRGEFSVPINAGQDQRREAVDHPRRKGFPADILDGVIDLIPPRRADGAVPEIEAEDRPLRAAGGREDRRRDRAAVLGARADPEITPDDLDPVSRRVDPVALSLAGELPVPDPADDPLVHGMVGRDLVQAERVDPLDRDRKSKAARGKPFDRFGVGDERLAQKVVHRLVGEPVGVGTVQDLYAVGRLAVAERQTDIADHRFLRRIALRIVEGDLRAVRPFPLEKDGVDPVLNASLIGFGDLFPVGAMEREELELAAVEGGVLVFVHHHRKTHRRRAEREVERTFKAGPRRALAVGDVGEIFDLGTDIGDRFRQFAVLPLDLAALLDEGAEIVVGIGAAAGTGERRKTGHAGNDLVEIPVARIPDKPGHGSLLKSDLRFRRLPVDQLAALGHKTRKSRFGKVDERTTAGDIPVVQFGHEFVWLCLGKTMMQSSGMLKFWKQIKPQLHIKILFIINMTLYLVWN